MSLLSLPLPSLVERALLALPGDDVQIDLDVDWLSRNIHLVYPLLAVGAVALIVLGILTAWRSQEISGVLKVEYKREIIAQLRREVAGLSVEKLARRIRLSTFKTAKIVDEMERDGILVPEVRKPDARGAGVTVYRMRGISQD